MAARATKKRKAATNHKDGKSNLAKGRVGKSRWMNQDLRKVTRERASELVLNIVELNKATFDGTAKIVTSVQEKTEDRFVKVVADASWMPKEGRKVIVEWVRMMRRGRNDFRKTVDASFDLVHDYIERVVTVKAKNGKPHVADAAPRKARQGRKVARPRATAATAKAVTA